MKFHNYEHEYTKKVEIHTVEEKSRLYLVASIVKFKSRRRPIHQEEACTSHIGLSLIMFYSINHRQRKTLNSTKNNVNRTKCSSSFYEDYTMDARHRGRKKKQ